MTLGDAFVLFSKKLETSIYNAGEHCRFELVAFSQVAVSTRVCMHTSSAGQAGENATISTGKGRAPSMVFSHHCQWLNQGMRFPYLWGVCSLGVSSPKTLVVAQSPSSLPLGPSYHTCSAFHALNSWDTGWPVAGHSGWGSLSRNCHQSSSLGSG